MLKRNLILGEAEKLTRKPNFTREDSARVDSLLRLADALPANGNGNSHNEDAQIASRRTEPDYAEYALAFNAYLRSGEKHDLWQVKEIFRRDYTPQSAAVDEQGGAVVPRTFAVELEKSLKATDPLFSEATLVFTDRGHAFSHPVSDDWEKATIVNESALEPDGVTRFSAVSWDRTPKWSTGICLCPVELLQDSAFGFESVFADIAGRRFARGIGEYFVGKVLDGAPSALTSASATAVTGDELLTLMGSIDPGYASRGKFLMNFASYISILKLKSSTGGDYLFKAEIGPDGYPILLGRSVLISPSMPNMATSETAIAFGDPSKFLRREVRNSLKLRVAREKYIEEGQFGFNAQMRVDGQMVKSQQGSPLDENSPFKVITQHS